MISYGLAFGLFIAAVASLVWLEKKRPEETFPAEINVSPPFDGAQPPSISATTETGWTVTIASGFYPLVIKCSLARGYAFNQA